MPVKELDRGSLPDESVCWPGRIFASVGYDASRLSARLRSFAASCASDGEVHEDDVMDLVADVLKLERSLVEGIQYAWKLELQNRAGCDEVDNSQ